jgi:hypothetical protein
MHFLEIGAGIFGQLAWIGLPRRHQLVEILGDPVARLGQFQRIHPAGQLVSSQGLIDDFPHPKTPNAAPQTVHCNIGIPGRQAPHLVGLFDGKRYFDKDSSVTLP